MNDLRAVVLGVVVLTLMPTVCWSGLADRDGEPGELAYVALGASDAAGIGAFPLTNGYVFKIADALAARGEPVAIYNLGIPGATIEGIETATSLFLLARSDVDLITIWMGSNDIIRGMPARQFEETLRALLTRLRERTNAFLVIANLVDLTRLPRFDQTPDDRVTAARIAAFNRAIRRQAIAFRLPVVNLFGQIDPTDDVTSFIDGFHPNNRGHQRLARLFLRLIVPRLQGPLGRERPAITLVMIAGRGLARV